MFSGWQRQLGDSITVHAIDLPGRGRRLGKPLGATIHEAVADIDHGIRGLLDLGPYAFFGHSLGSWIAYELAQKLLREGRPGPRHVFVAAKEAPHVKRASSVVMHTLSDDLLKRALVQLGGIPREIADHEEAFDFFLPVIRADYRMAEHYEFGVARAKLPCPVTMFAGTHDEIQVHDVARWNELAHIEGPIHTFPGGHFFLKDHLPGIAAVLNDVLSPNGSALTYAQGAT